MLKQVFAWIAARMGISAVTDFELHFFTSYSVVMTACFLRPGYAWAWATLAAVVFGVKELWFDPVYKNQNEPLWVGLRDFAYYTAGAAAALALQLA